jgi:hypothetical protein
MSRDQQQKYDYLDEHLPYQLKMIRFDFGELKQEMFYLRWNSHFQSFSVSARSLANFLANKDPGNLRASDFVPGFRARKGDLSGPLNKLREQVFHLSKRRPRQSVHKFDIGNATEVLAWIEENVKKFLQELSPEDRKHWNELKADPGANTDYLMSTGPTLPGAPAPPSASSSITSVGTQNQTSSVARFRIIDRTAQSKDKNPRSRP